MTSGMLSFSFLLEVQPKLSFPKPFKNVDTEEGLFNSEKCDLSPVLCREEVKEQLEKKKKGSRALAEFEEKMNEVGDVPGMLVFDSSYLVCHFSFVISNGTKSVTAALIFHFTPLRSKCFASLVSEVKVVCLRS